MKAKLLLMLFLVSLSFFGEASEHHRKKPSVRCTIENCKRRSLFTPSVQAEDINDCLYLTFQFSLDDTDITILDKDGNEVINEKQTLIYDGRVIAIPQSDGYPYSIEIVSPTVEIQGEIVLEEYF